MNGFCVVTFDFLPGRTFLVPDKVGTMSSGAGWHESTRAIVLFLALMRRFFVERGAKSPKKQMIDR